MPHRVTAPMPKRRHISARERMAIFIRAEGKCHICGSKIAPTQRWDVEHVIPRELEGTEAPMDENLQPAHQDCHKPKTAEDARHIAKAKRMRQRESGIARQARQKIPGSRGTGYRVRLTSDGPKVEKRE